MVKREHVLYGVIALVGIFAVWSYANWTAQTQALAAIPQATAAFSAEFIDEPSDGWDTQGTVPTDGANVTLLTPDITGLPTGTGLGMERTAYLMYEVDGTTSEYISGFSTFEVKEHAGASVVDYLVLDEVAIYTYDDRDEITALNNLFSVDEDNEVDTSIDYKINAGAEHVMELVFKLDTEHTADISAEIGWDVNLKAITSDDDDEFTGYVITALEQ